MQSNLQADKRHNVGKCKAMLPHDALPSVATDKVWAAHKDNAKACMAIAVCRTAYLSPLPFHHSTKEEIKETIL